MTLPRQCPCVELAEQAQRGDVGAFNGLYEWTHAAIYGFLRRMVPSEEDARDLTQETYVEAWRSLRSLHHAPAFRSWIFRIAANKAKDHLKRRQIPTIRVDGRPEDRPEEAVEFEFPDPAATPLDRLIDRERAGQLRDALEALSEDHRTVVALYYISGLEVSEIAGMLRLPRNTVVSRLSRARDQLRRRLAGWMEDRNEM